ncbi:MAG TPA: glycosyltransferase [Solirubrobacteraceae bacterium]|nr:glycosyltransferase [Solirubrobacteraceae bacterium]
MNAPRRIFLGAFGQPGHAFPMLALGAALARRGHVVTYETWAHWRDDVEAAGMRFVAAPEYPVFPTPDQPLEPYEIVHRAAAETREQIQAARAEVVVHDILTLAPALAGELEGVAVATLIPHLYPVTGPGHPPYAIGARLPRTRMGRELWHRLNARMEGGLRLGRDQLNATRGRLGLPAQTRLHGGLSQQLCLVGTFPQLEYPRAWPAHTHVVGPLFWEPPSAAVNPPPGDGPLVLVAPSTAQDPRQRMLQAALTGLRGLSVPRGAGAGPPSAAVRVVAATNRRPLDRPVPDSPHTRLVNWLSYTQTMPAADLVVCHAGHGTLVRALACGTPVLAVPHLGDMGENAARLDWSGAGLRLPWRLLSPRTLRAAVSLALDPTLGLAGRAAEFGAWARAHDGADRAAALVESLVGGG